MKIETKTLTIEKNDYEKLEKASIIWNMTIPSLVKSMIKEELRMSKEIRDFENKEAEKKLSMPKFFE